MSTLFARSHWSTSEARENYEAVADSSSTAFHQAFDNIGKCKSGRLPRVEGGDALSNVSPRVGDASRPRRGSLHRTNERTLGLEEGQYQSVFRPVLHDQRIFAHHRAGAREEGAGLRGRRSCHLKRLQGAILTAARKKHVVRAGRKFSPSP